MRILDHWPKRFLKSHNLLFIYLFIMPKFKFIKGKVGGLDE